MSTVEFKTGQTVNDATKFAFGNIATILRVGWLPITLTLLGLALVSWTFFQPLVLAYIDFFQEVNAAVEAGRSAPDVDPDIFEQAFREMSPGSVGAGYTLFMLIAILGYAIPMTAFARMMVLGEHYGGPFYLRATGREMSVGLTYLAITALLAVVMTVVVVAMSIIIAILAGGAGDEGAVIALFTLTLIIVVFGVMLWFFARFGMALPIAAVEGGIPLGRSWSLTKGHGGTLAWAILLGYLVLTVMSFVFLMAVSLVTGIVLETLTLLGSNLAPYLIGFVWAVGYVAMYAFGTAFFVAIFAGPYKKLREAGAA